MAVQGDDYDCLFSGRCCVTDYCCYSLSRRRCMKPRLYADFNKLDQNRNAILSCQGTRKDLEYLKTKLTPGLKVVLYMPDDIDELGAPDCLEVEAVVEYDPSQNEWIGIFEWDELCYRSEKKNTSE